MSDNTDGTYARYWQQFEQWIHDQYGYGATARTAIAAIRDGLGLTSTQEIAGEDSIRTVALTPHQVELSWPVLKERDRLLYLFVRVVHTLGVDYRSVTGVASQYRGLTADAIRKVGDEHYISLHRRGGGFKTYRFPSQLYFELEPLIKHPYNNNIGRPSISEERLSIFGISHSAMFYRLKPVRKELQELGVIPDRLPPAAFRLWQMSELYRPWSNPMSRDARELRSA